MIISISVALIIAGALLVLMRRTGVPEIPIYLLSGILLSVVATAAHQQGLVSHSFVETAVMRELALLGLGVLIFYNTSGMVLDPRRETAVDSFRTVVWLSAVSLAGVTGVALAAGFSPVESVLLGTAASVGSTLLDAGLVKEEARKSHLQGWLTEDMDFYDDVMGIVVLTAALGVLSGGQPVLAAGLSLAGIFVGLVVRKQFSSVMLNLTQGKNELILLLGIATLITAVWTAEHLGITALPGVYFTGLLFADTELGFRVRERFSAVKDFFTALSFFAIGYLLALPPAAYLLAGVGIIVFSLAVKPLASTQALRLQGYDLRTSFLASVQYSQISALVLFGSLLMQPFTGNGVFESVAIAFSAGIVLSHLVEEKEGEIFERVFSSYELDPEKSSLPEELQDHVVIAGYDWKTEGIEEVTERQCVAVDYDMERVKQAAENGIPHLLADLLSSRTWEMLNLDEAAFIVSAVEDEAVVRKMEQLETGAELVHADAGSEEVRQKLREMLESAVEEEKER